MTENRLEHSYDDILRALPKDSSNRFMFTGGMLPRPPEVVSSERLVALIGDHYYNTLYRADVIRFFATPETYRRFGIMLLTLVFATDSSQTEITLAHTTSDIGRLSVLPPRPREEVSGYLTAPKSFQYNPRRVENRSMPYGHPFDECVLPCFDLAWSPGRSSRREERPHKNAVSVHSGDIGLVLLADLFLNLGLQSDGSDAIRLETAAWSGSPGVGRFSAEVEFYFPDGPGWPRQLGF